MICNLLYTNVLILKWVTQFLNSLYVNQKIVFSYIFHYTCILILFIGNFS